jgi:short-subunit dehydrogenase
MNKGLRKELSILSAITATGFLLKNRNGAASLLGIASLALRFWPTSYSVRRRSVVITGGSRGLGMAIAEQFLSEGSNVTLLARDEAELGRAQSMLQKRTGRTPSIVACDMTMAADVESALTEAEASYGPIDILINNAGTIVVGPFASMDSADFSALLQLQLHAVVNVTQNLAKRWKESGGRIANICSIGGKIAVPHMSTYCAAKFALAGLSQTLATELKRDRIIVTTVFPGLMRTGSPIQAVIKGDHESEYAWFALGDTVPGLSVSAEYAAKRILEAIRNGDNELVFPSTMKLAALAQSQFPELFALAMQTAAAFFPKGQSEVRKTGAESKDWLEQQSWYSPFRPLMEESKAKLNQVEKSDAGFNLGLEKPKPEASA